MRTMKEKPATPQQVKALHATFRRMGYEDGERHAFISRFTEGRTDSTAGLTMGEARRLLGALNERDTEAAREEARRVCRQIYSLSFRISCLNKGFAGDTPEDFEMNKAKISLQQAKDEVDDVKAQLALAIQGYWINATTNQQRFKSAGASVGSAQDSYELLSEQFRLGLKNIVELTTAKTTLLNAQQSRLESKYTAILYLKLLDFYKGEELNMI